MVRSGTFHPIPRLKQTDSISIITADHTHNGVSLQGPAGSFLRSITMIMKCFRTGQTPASHWLKSSRRDRALIW